MSLKLNSKIKNINTDLIYNKLVKKIKDTICEPAEETLEKPAEARIWTSLL